MPGKFFLYNFYKNVNFKASIERAYFYPCLKKNVGKEGIIAYYVVTCWLVMPVAVLTILCTIINT